MTKDANMFKLSFDDIPINCYTEKDRLQIRKLIEDINKDIEEVCKEMDNVFDDIVIATRISQLIGMIKKLKKK